MWIIKIGGSLSLTPSLQQWLDCVAKHGKGKVLIVPGGGLYADAVRAFQQQRKATGLATLSASTAHQLAIYGMDQMARSFVGLQAELRLVSLPEEISSSSLAGMVWLPSHMLLSYQRYSALRLPEGWEVTSDSLAAWLANVLGASHLILVKSHPVVLTERSLTKLEAEQVIDPYFTHLLNEMHLLAQKNSKTCLTTTALYKDQANLFEDGFIDSKLPAPLILT